jgi:hypothetical protein
LPATGDDVDPPKPVDEDPAGEAVVPEETSAVGSSVDEESALENGNGEAESAETVVEKGRFHCNNAIKSQIM